VTNWVNTFSPKPARGELESAMNPADHEGKTIFEVWCHPDDTASLLDGGISHAERHAGAGRAGGYVAVRGPVADHGAPWGVDSGGAQGAFVSGFVHPTAVIGDPPEHRKHIFRFYEGGYDQYSPPFWTPVISPSAIVNAYVTIDAGIHAATFVGSRTLVMKHAHLGHDVVVGSDCEIGVGVVISGECVIGDRVQIGGSAWIKPLVNGRRRGPDRRRRCGDP
jgi:hypothetical protein